GNQVEDALTVGDQPFTARDGANVELEVLDLVPHGGPVEGTLLERWEERGPVGVELRAGRLRMLPGALHRDRLSRTVREQPGDAVVQAVGMAVVAVAPAGVGHPTPGALGSRNCAFRPDTGVEELVPQVDDRGLRPGGGKARRLDLLDLVVQRGVIA